jgi:formate-dependent nitrite reductase membrane component NrfD
MSRVPLPEIPDRVPDAQSERRLSEIRREAMERGRASGGGITPVGAPFPKASPETGYYGVPLLKEPQWTWEVPLYFFVGGAAGAASVIASAASMLTDDPGLVRKARLIAAAGGLISPALLVSDLGRPSRFLNMLRVIKLQSPMSVGAWTLVAFSNFAAASAFASLVRDRIGDILPVRLVEHIAGSVASLSGLALSTYTGVLIGSTAVPVWNENVITLPHHFAASGVNSAVSILELMGHDDSRALNLLGIAASAYEVYQGVELETRRDIVNQAVHKGLSGVIVRSGGVLSGPVPLGLRLAYAVTGNLKFRRAAAWSSIAGSLLTRFGWIQAGRASAKDHRIPLELGEAAPEVRKSSQELAA